MNKRKSGADDAERSKRQRMQTPQNSKTLSTRIRKLPPPRPGNRAATGRASSVATTSTAKQTNVINVSRKKNAMNYVRRIEAMVLDNGYNKVILNTLSAAIPFTLSLIPLIRQRLNGDAVRFVLRTSTVGVVDEVVPRDKELDIDMQHRNQSALRVVMLVNGEDDEEDSEQVNQHADSPKKSKNRGVKRRLKDERKREERENEQKISDE